MTQNTTANLLTLASRAEADSGALGRALDQDFEGEKWEARIRKVATRSAASLRAYALALTQAGRVSCAESAYERADRAESCAG